MTGNEAREIQVLTYNKGPQLGTLWFMVSSLNPKAIRVPLFVCVCEIVDTSASLKILQGTIRKNHSSVELLSQVTGRHHFPNVTC